jgi:hypothetical protein
MRVRPALGLDCRDQQLAEAVEARAQRFGLGLEVFEGAPHGARLPSSEWRFHRDLYVARADIHAIVHVHSPFATTLACMRRGIPAFHYMIAVAGGRLNARFAVPEDYGGVHEVIALIDGKFGLHSFD